MLADAPVGCDAATDAVDVAGAPDAPAVADAAAAAEAAGAADFAEAGGVVGGCEVMPGVDGRGLAVEVPD